LLNVGIIDSLSPKIYGFFEELTDEFVNENAALARGQNIGQMMALLKKAAKVQLSDGVRKVL
jgi:hypothetical protein